MPAAPRQECLAARRKFVLGWPFSREMVIRTVSPQDGTRPDAPPSQDRISLASHRSRQQRRSGPESPQEEDAARGHLSRDEAPHRLRKAIRAARPREGGRHPPRQKTGAQAGAARGPPPRPEEADHRRPRRPPLRRAAPALKLRAPAASARPILSNVELSAAAALPGCEKP